MNKFKKFASFFLAFVMMFGTVLHVSAADETVETGDGSITITNAVLGQTYSIYKFMDLESATNDAFAYKMAEGYEGFVNSEENKGWLTINDGGYVE